MHTIELQKIEQEITECKECGGTGISKTMMRKRVTSFAKEYSSDKQEEKKLQKNRSKSKMHAINNKENPNNSSYGLCKCRITADLKRQLLIANLPLSISSVKYAEIISRDITIHGHRFVPIKKFIRFYVRNFQRAKSDAIGCNLFGGYGKGKTFTSQFIAMQVAKSRYTVHYMPFFSLIDLVNTNVFVNQLLAEIMNVDLLIIDDIGNEQSNRRNACGETAYLIKQRHRKRKPTIFIFNELSKRPEIKEVYGPAFYNICAESNMDVLFKTSISDEKTGKANIARLLKRLR